MRHNILAFAKSENNRTIKLNSDFLCFLLILCSSHSSRGSYMFFVTHQDQLQLSCNVEYVKKSNNVSQTLGRNTRRTFLSTFGMEMRREGRSTTTGILDLADQSSNTTHTTLASSQHWRGDEGATPSPSLHPLLPHHSS